MLVYLLLVVTFFVGLVCVFGVLVDLRFCFTCCLCFLVDLLVVLIAVLYGFECFFVLVVCC